MNKRPFVRLLLAALMMLACLPTHAIVIAIPRISDVNNWLNTLSNNVVTNNAAIYATIASPTFTGVVTSTNLASTYAPLTNTGPYQYTISGTNITVPASVIRWADGNLTPTVATTNWCFNNSTNWVGIDLWDFKAHVYLYNNDGATKWIARIVTSNGVVVLNTPLATTIDAPPSAINDAKNTVGGLGIGYPYNNYIAPKQKVILLGDSQSGAYYLSYGGVAANDGTLTNWFASLWDTNWFPSTFITNSNGALNVQTFNLGVGSEAQKMASLCIGTGMVGAQPGNPYGGFSYTFPFSADLESGQYRPEAMLSPAPNLVLITFHNYDAEALRIWENVVRQLRKKNIPVILMPGYPGNNSTGTNWTEGAYPYIPGIRLIADQYGCLFLDSFSRCIEDLWQGGYAVTNWYADVAATHAAPTGHGRIAAYVRSALNNYQQAPISSPQLPNRPLFAYKFGSYDSGQPFFHTEFTPVFNGSGCSAASATTNVGTFPTGFANFSPLEFLHNSTAGLTATTGNQIIVSHRMSMAEFLLCDVSTNTACTFSVTQNGTTFTTNTIDSSWAGLYGTGTNTGQYMKLYEFGTSSAGGTAWGGFNTLRSTLSGYSGGQYYMGQPSEFSMPAYRITILSGTMNVYGAAHFVPNYEEVPLMDGRFTFGNTNSPTTSTTGWDTMAETYSSGKFYRRGTDTLGDYVLFTFKGPWAVVWLEAGSFAGRVAIYFDGRAAPSVLNSSSASGTYPNYWWDLYQATDHFVWPVYYTPTGFGTPNRDMTGGTDQTHTIKIVYTDKNPSAGASPSVTTATRRLSFIGASVGTN